MGIIYTMITVGGGQVPPLNRSMNASIAIERITQSSTSQVEPVNHRAHLMVEEVEEIFADLSDGDPPVAAVLRQLHLAMQGRSDAQKAARAVIEQAAGKPYFDLSDYMGRTWLREKRPDMGYCARVHKVMRSDHDRALHDHPWHNASIVLEGGYWEVVPGDFQVAMELHHFRRTALTGTNRGITISEALALNELVQAHGAQALNPSDTARLAALGVHWRAPMDFIKRSASSLHRLIVPRGTTAWSLFVMRPKVCEWGFLTVDGWHHNEAYLEKLGRDA